MLTFTLQCVVTVLVLAFGALALDVGRRLRATVPFHAAGWTVSGAAFVVHGVSKGAQNVFGFLALQAGSPSPVMSRYLAWAPVFDHGRTFLMLAMCVALLALAFVRSADSRPYWRAAYGGMALGLLVGGVMGASQGELIGGVHFPAVAVWDVVELLVLMGALFALLLTNRADRHLWASQAAYALSLSLGVFWFTMLSWIDTPGVWRLPTWSVHSVRVVIHFAMLVLVVYRARAVHGGRHVPGLSESARPVAPMLG